MATSIRNSNIRNRNGWIEAAIAWAVCASIHREYAKGKDPFYKTRQADFKKHEATARANLMESVASAAKTPGTTTRNHD